MYLILALVACDGPAKESLGPLDSPNQQDSRIDSTPVESKPDSPSESTADSPVDSPEESSEVCVEGSGRCDGNILYVCHQGVEEPTPCEGSCDATNAVCAACGDHIASPGEDCRHVVPVSGVDPSSISSGYCGLPAVSAGDLNGDGLDELAWMTADGERFLLSLAQNEGDGDFSLLKDGEEVGAFPDNLERLNFVDMNVDGALDLLLVLGVDGGMAALQSLAGDGTGGLSVGDRMDFGSAICHLEPGDFNNDGVQDLLAGSDPYGTAPLLFLDGAAAFVASGSHALDDCATRALVAADLNNDGYLDATAACGFESSVTRALQPRRGLGDGGFAGWDSLVLDTNPMSLAAGDVDADGAMDLVVADVEGESRVALGAGDGTFSAFTLVGSTTSGPGGTAAWDVDMDGDSDLIDRSTGSWWASNGDGSFAAPLPLVAGASGRVWVQGYFDLDGLPDLLLQEEDGSFWLVLTDGG